MTSRWPSFFLLLLLLTSGTAKRRKSSGVNHVNNRKRECESECAGEHEDDRSNCVLRCQSEACYAEVYLPEELEPGEIDLKRQRAFTACTSKEARQIQQNRFKKKEPAEAEDADSDTSPEADAATPASTSGSSNAGWRGLDGDAPQVQVEL